MLHWSSLLIQTFYWKKFFFFSNKRKIFKFWWIFVVNFIGLIILLVMLPYKMKQPLNSFFSCTDKFYFLSDDICDYFGVKIAIYFAWLGHYTKALTMPAFFGFFVWLCCYGRDQVFKIYLDISFKIKIFFLI